MSEEKVEKEVIGQIKINFYKNAETEIEVLGQLLPRKLNALPIRLNKAIRRHTSAIRRGKPKVDMADKGVKLDDLKKEEMDKMNDNQPVAGADELNVITPPPTAAVNPQGSVANNTKEEQEQEDGANSRSEEVRGDDEGSGSQEGSTWRPKG